MKTVRDILERCDISNNQTKDPLTVDQALKELEKLLLECKPQKRKPTLSAFKAVSKSQMLEARNNTIYNQAVDDYEKNIKKVIGGK